MPELDQSLNLKAALKDEVSPALEKINKTVKTTREALLEFQQSLEKAAEAIGSAAGGMSQKNRKAAEDIQEDLKRTGGAFKELGEEAQQSSKQIGEALENAFKAGNQAKSTEDLDDELENLKRTLQGMAATNRPMSAKAKNIRAIGQDTLNKKVIPAFQELHSTLDDFPDILGDVNTNIGKNITLSEKMSSTLATVNERVSGLGSLFDRIKNSALDLAGAVTTSWFAVQGDEVRDIQTIAGRQRGRKSFAAMEQLAPRIQMATRAPRDVWGPAYEKLLDTSSLALEMFPKMTDQMTALAKATGLSTDAFAELFVQMSEISGLTGDKWFDVSKKINFFASSSRASISDIHDVLADATTQMVKFSRESRKAYAESAMTAAAQTANAGLGSGTAGTLWEKAHDTRMAQRMNAMIAQSGLQGDVTRLVQSGDQAGLVSLMMEAMAVQAQRTQENTGVTNIAAGTAADQFRGLWGDLVEPIEALIALERRRVLAEQGTTFSGEARRLYDESGSVDFAALAGDIRGTAKEKAQQINAIANASGMQIGIHTIKAIEQGMDPLLSAAFTISNKLEDMPEMAKRGIAFFSIGMNVVSALKHLIPGGDKLLGGALETLGGSLIAGYTAQQVLAGGDVGAQAEALAGGNAELKAIIEKGLYDKLNSLSIPDIIGDTRGMTHVGNVDAITGESFLLDPRTGRKYEGIERERRLRFGGEMADARAAVGNNDDATRMKAAQELIQSTNALAQQQMSLGGSATVARAAYVQEHRDELEKQLTKLNLKTWKEDLLSLPGMLMGGVRSAEATMAQLDRQMLEDLLNASPEKMLTMDHALTRFITNEQAGIGQEATMAYAQQLQDSIAASTRMLSELQQGLTEQEIKDSPEIQLLQSQIRDSISMLETTLRNNTLGITDEQINKMIDGLTEAIIRATTNVRNNEGIDAQNPVGERAGNKGRR